MPYGSVLTLVQMMRTDFKRKINIKYFMVAYLGILLCVSSATQRLPAYFVAGTSIVILYSLFDLAWTRLRDRVWYLPVSSWISGLVLSVVAITNPSAWQVVALCFFAVLSKQLLHFGKTRHVFNPAAFGMAVVNLFVPSVSWWAVSWGIIPTIIASIVGLFILWRQERWHVASSFIAAFALTSVIFSQTFLPFLMSGPAIFFMTVMLIEPLTSNFPTRNRRMAYGAVVGLFAAGTSPLLRFIPGANVDPLIAGLLLGNLLACLLFLPSRERKPSTIPGPRTSGAVV